MRRQIAFRLAVAMVSLGFGFRAEAVSIAVTSNGDSGGGTFREAIDSADTDATIDEIVFDEGLDPIELLSAVTYGGAQKLEILGGGNTIKPDAGYSGDLFVSNGGADLVVKNLIFAEGDEEAIFIDIPGAATGVVGVCSAA